MVKTSKVAEFLVLPLQKYIIILVESLLKLLDKRCVMLDDGKGLLIIVVQEVTWCWDELR